MHWKSRESLAGSCSVKFHIMNFQPKTPGKYKRYVHTPALTQDLSRSQNAMDLIFECFHVVGLHQNCENIFSVFSVFL